MVGVTWNPDISVASPRVVWLAISGTWPGRLPSVGCSFCCPASATPYGWGTPAPTPRLPQCSPCRCALRWLMFAGADAAMLPLALRYARVIFAGLIAMELVPGIGFMINAAGAPNAMLC